MVEVKRELTTYRVQYVCDKCKKGFMVYDMATNEGYRHQCSYCGVAQALDAMYPYLEDEQRERFLQEKS